MVVPAIVAVIGAVNVSVTCDPLLGWLLSICLLFGCMFRWLVLAVYPVGSGLILFVCWLRGLVRWLRLWWRVPVPPTFTGVVPVLVINTIPALFTCIVLSGMVTVVGILSMLLLRGLVVVVPRHCGCYWCGEC